MRKNKKLNSALDWKFWLGLALSAVFMYLAFRDADIGNTWSVIKSADLLLLTLATLLLLSQYIIRAWRWYIFLEPIQRTSFSNRLLSILIGFAANCLLPVRLGEFIRANYLGHKEQISKSTTFATVIIERIFDGLILLLVLLIAILTIRFPEESFNVSGISIRTLGLFIFLAYILGILFLIGFRYKTEWSLAVFNTVFFFLPIRIRAKLTDIIRNFSLGLLPAKNLQGWILAIFYSLLLWTVSLFQIHLVAMSIGVEIPFVATFLVLAFASFGVMIPSAPGFVGTFHFWVKYGFILFGISHEEALSAAILFHATFFFPTIIVGFFSFLALQLSVGELSSDPKRL